MLANQSVSSKFYFLFDRSCHNSGVSNYYIIVSAALKASEQANEQLLKEISETKSQLAILKRQLEQSNLEIEQAIQAAESAATVSEEVTVKKVKAPKVSSPLRCLSDGVSLG